VPGQGRIVPRVEVLVVVGPLPTHRGPTVLQPELRTGPAVPDLSAALPDSDLPATFIAPRGNPPVPGADPGHPITITITEVPVIVAPIVMAPIVPVPVAPVGI
jgi:hypothetical protein